MNFGGMPRGGGGRKVTHDAQICSRICVFVFDATEKKSNPSFFFPAFALREFVSEASVDISSFFSEMIVPLSFCVPNGVFGREIGFSKTRARFVRERERERDERMMWFPISPP